MNSGAEASPETMIRAVTSAARVSATKSSVGMTSPVKVTRPRLKSRRWVAILSRPRRRSKPPVSAGAPEVPPTCSSPPSSASMPRPRMKTRPGAETVMSSTASKAGARPPLRPAAARALRSAARRAAAWPFALTWRMPSIGRRLDGSRSGTATSMVTTPTRPAMRGRCASGPARSRPRSATALTSPLSTSWARRPSMRIVPGKPASGSSLTLPRAESVPPPGVCAARRSIASSGPLAAMRASSPVSFTPCRASLKLPPDRVAAPVRRGAASVPPARRSSTSWPVSRRPSAASRALARVASARPWTARSSAPSPLSGAVPWRSG